MGSSIRRRRGRARVESYSFQSLFWLLTREAAIRILTPSALGASWERNSRALVAKADTTDLRSHTAAILKARPERQYYPAVAPAEDSHRIDTTAHL